MDFKRQLMAWTMTLFNPLGFLASTEENVELKNSEKCLDSVIIIICFFSVKVKGTHRNKMQNLKICLYSSNLNITFCLILNSICMVSLSQLVDIVNVKSKKKEIVIFTQQFISPKCQHFFPQDSSWENKEKCVEVKFFHFIFLLFII